MRRLLPLIALLALPLLTSVQAQPLTLLGRYETGIFDEGAAEIVTYDAARQRLLFVNAESNEVVALDLSDPANPTEAFTIDMDPYGNEANSLDVFGDLVAVAVEADPATEPGTVVFLSAADGSLQAQATAGALPDGLAFSPSGDYVVVANEGEPNDDYTVDPEGSITVIDLRDFPSGPIVNTAGFADFNAGGARAGELPAGVRIFGPGASVAQDLEPEFVAFSPDGATAYVTLQENNAVAVVDVASATVSAILALGTKDHSLALNELDPSNRDDGIVFRTGPVRGLYQPDAIAAYAVSGQTYLVTANEGDARDYDGFSEEVRIADLTLDAAAFPDAATLQDDAVFGRLRTTNASGDTDGDGDFDVIYSYGARSFSIWNAGDGSLVYDSANDFEQILATELPDDFNSTNDENGSFDSRSDDKGPEPEGVVLGTVDGRTYAFIGLERVGGVMVYDVTEPTGPSFVQYVTSRDFSGDAEAGTAGDLGPEGLVFISAEDSPTGVPLLAVAHEVSGSVAIFAFMTSTGAEDAALPRALALHGNYPNPFNPATTLRFDLPQAATVRVIVYDLLGRVVQALPAAAVAAGAGRTLSLDGTRLASGVYLYRLEADYGTHRETRAGRFALIK